MSCCLLSKLGYGHKRDLWGQREEVVSLLFYVEFGCDASLFTIFGRVIDEER